MTFGAPRQNYFSLHTYKVKQATFCQGTGFQGTGVKCEIKKHIVNINYRNLLFYLNKQSAGICMVRTTILKDSVCPCDLILLILLHLILFILKVLHAARMILILLLSAFSQQSFSVMSYIWHNHDFLIFNFSIVIRLSKVITGSFT